MKKTLTDFLLDIGIKGNEISTIKSVVAPDHVKLFNYEIILNDDERTINSIVTSEQNQTIEIDTIWSRR